jgi:hypothetical protein
VVIIVKLKVTKTGEQCLKDTKEENRKRGKRSRTKGANFERTIAKKFKAFFGVDLVRTPQSGGFAKKSVKADEFRGDIVSADDTIDLALHIECKNAKTWSLPSWLKQSESDCPKGKKPVVIMHKDGSSQDYITMKLEDFFECVNPDKVILKR